MPTGIPYLDEAISPLGWGCWGPGGTAEHPRRCSYCYAARLAHRGLRECPDCRAFVPHWHPEQLGKLTHWKRPRRVGVQFMGDLWGAGVPDEHIDAVFTAAMSHRQHTFIFLTKAAGRLSNYLRQPFYCNMVKRFPNLWLGVTVTNQTDAEERIPLLLKTPAAVRFVSVEPMMAPIDVRNGWLDGKCDHPCTEYFKWRTCACTRGRPPNTHLDWVIAGCQSGPKARPAEVDWFRSLRDECRAARVPFYLKQMQVAGKLVTCPPLDGKTYTMLPGDRWPEEV